MRALAGVFFFAWAVGCEGVAPVDINYRDSGAEAQGPLQMAQDGGFDGGDIIMAPGDAIGTDGFCGCDYTSGYGCCVLPTMPAPFCVEDLSMNGCAAKGGMFVGCARDDSTTDSQCCWHYGTGAGSLTAYATACGQNAHSCTTNSDCPGSTCEITQCKGLKVGACGTKPACP